MIVSNLYIELKNSKSNRWCKKRLTDSYGEYMVYTLIWWVIINKRRRKDIEYQCEEYFCRFKIFPSKRRDKIKIFCQIPNEAQHFDSIHLSHNRISTRSLIDLFEYKIIGPIMKILIGDLCKLQWYINRHAICIILSGQARRKSNAPMSSL